MTDPTTSPCLNGLTRDCFKQYPVWAKKAFALRLLFSFLPPDLSRFLPKYLRFFLVTQGADLPPAVDPEALPPGLTITPDAQIPPDWDPGYPLPPGLTIYPGTKFPDGWTPLDPLPAGATLKPGAAVPPDWLPPGPLPPGVLPPPLLPPIVQESGLSAPLFLDLSTPGPLRPKPSPTGDAYFFNEPFNDLSTNSWTDNSSVGGSAEIVGGRLKLQGTGFASYSNISCTVPGSWPDNFTVTIAATYETGTGDFSFSFFTGTYNLHLNLSAGTDSTLKAETGTCTYSGASYIGTQIIWTIQVTENLATLKRDGTPVVTDCDIFQYAGEPGDIIISLIKESEAYIDYLNITEDS